MNIIEYDPICDGSSIDDKDNSIVYMPYKVVNNSQIVVN